MRAYSKELIILESDLPLRKDDKAPRDIEHQYR